MATSSPGRPDRPLAADAEQGRGGREPVALSRRRAVRDLGGIVTGAVVPLSWPVRAKTSPAERGGPAGASTPDKPDQQGTPDRSGAPEQQGMPQQPGDWGGRNDPGRGVALAAAWQEGSRHFVGVLAPGAGGVAPVSRQPVPTRAHGVAVEAEGTVLVVARRPGDWLARFDPAAGVIRDWFWSDGEHSFNGHVVRSADGRRLFTTETSLETGAGSVGVRDARSLALLDRWPTAGRDPHELLPGPDGALWVANGGLETRPETGRVKHHVDRMDSSLVRLDAMTGRITGQWRLSDRRLGLRHLALAGDGTVAIALQAEHDDAQAKEAAPVLALCDRRRGLRAVDLPPAMRLSGYGGSVAASGRDLEVSCPRSGLVARWRWSAGEWRWQAPLPLPEACALAPGWHGGAGWALHAVAPSSDSGTPTIERWPIADAIRLDNHWAAIGRT